MSKYVFTNNQDPVTDMNYYAPNGIKYVYCSTVFKELGINNFVGWKLFIHNTKWCVDIERNYNELETIPYIGKNIKIFRNRTVDMNYWKVSEENAKEMKKRFRLLNPYVKARVMNVNKHINEYQNKKKEEKDIKNRQCIANYEGRRVAFTGEITDLSIREVIDRKRNLIIPSVMVTISNVVTEYGEYLDHVNPMYSKEIYLKHFKWLTIGTKVQCVGTVTKYAVEDKYGFGNVTINKQK